MDDVSKKYKQELQWLKRKKNTSVEKLKLSLKKKHFYRKVKTVTEKETHKSTHMEHRTL